MISRGLGLERYRASRLGEGGLDELESLRRRGVFTRVEARQVDGPRGAKLGRLTGRHAVAAAEVLKRRLRLQQGEEDAPEGRGVNQEEGQTIAVGRLAGGFEQNRPVRRCSLLDSKRQKISRHQTRGVFDHHAVLNSVCVLG